MLPQFQNNISPVNSVEPKPKRGHEFLLTLTLIMLLSGGYALWYLCNLPVEPDPETFAVVKNDQSVEMATSTADWKTKEFESDNRILLIRDNIASYAKYNEPWSGNGGPVACQEKFNHDAPNEMVLYHNPLLGFSVEIPYNKNWGNDKYKILPYEEYQHPFELEITYGHIGVYEGCGWSRLKSIYVMEKQTAEDVVKSNRIESAYPFFNPIIEKIGDLQVVKYKMDGIGDGRTAIIVIGHKYNYRLINDLSSSYTAIEKIIGNLEFID